MNLRREGLFLADAEQAAARELLGQRARALPGFARAQVHPRRARDAAQVDAVVAVEVAVLDRLQAGDQQLGHFLDAHQAALFLLLAVERGDARRVQARGLQRLLARRRRARWPRASPTAPRRCRRGATCAVDIEEAAAGDQPAPAVARSRCRGARRRRRRDSRRRPVRSSASAHPSRCRRAAPAGARTRGSGNCQRNWPKRSPTWWLR